MVRRPTKPRSRKGSEKPPSWARRDAAGRLTVNVADAKAHLSEVMRLAERGNEVLLARDGQAVVRVSRLSEPAGERTFGADRGLFEVPDDFDRVPLGPEWDEYAK